LPSFFRIPVAQETVFAKADHLTNDHDACLASLAAHVKQPRMAVQVSMGSIRGKV
jgi:hypothetical protein